MSANNITQLCQLAAVAYLKTQALAFLADAEAQIVPGIRNDDVVLPQVVCQCNRATPADDPFEGNWEAVLRVEVRSNCSDSDEVNDHHANAGLVFSRLMSDTIKQHLAEATTGFTVQHVIPREQGWETEDDVWVSYLELSVMCAGRDFDTWT